MTSPAPAITPEPRAARGLPAALGGDERLARLVGQGHERAFAVLYDRYHQPIYRYVRAMVRHECDAQDVLQSVFAKAFVALAEGRRDAPLRPWLYRIAHNEAISTIRRRRPDVDLSAAGDPPAPSVEEVAGERARLAMLVADLQALTERQRGALVMRELSGLSHEEIDAALGLDPGAAKQTIFEARRSLAEFSQGRAMSCDDVCRAISDGNGRTLRGRKIRAHLRDCAGCGAFAAAISGRSRDLRVIAPPLPAAAAAGVLAQLLGRGGHGGATAGGATAGGATAAAAGGTSVTATAGGGAVGGVAAKVAALGASTKALAAVAVVAAGAGGVMAPLLHSGSSARHHQAPPSRLRGRGTPAAPGGTAGPQRAGRTGTPRAPAGIRAVARGGGHRSAAATRAGSPAQSGRSATGSHGGRGARTSAPHRLAATGPVSRGSSHAPAPHRGASTSTRANGAPSRTGRGSSATAGSLSSRSVSGTGTGSASGRGRAGGTSTAGSSSEPSRAAPAAGPQRTTAAQHSNTVQPTATPVTTTAATTSAAIRRRSGT